nr:MgtC/SapB family protein [Fusobacterium mortiferum]
MNSSITELSLHIIILRIFLSTIIGGIIGYERGSNNQAAGFRTHILVCLGATLISLIQEQLKINLLNYAIENPLSSQVLKTDLGRLGAQVISGIGFLGAGTILREEKNNSRTNYSCFSLGYRVHRTWNRMGIL